jgi:hypothetical protein
MLARAEEEFQAGFAEGLTEMTAIESLLAGLFDYAGLYPPAGLNLQSAANNYLEYARGKHASALGRFIINADRLEELRSIVGDSLEGFRLSVIVPEGQALDAVLDGVGGGTPIETLEIRCEQPGAIERTAAKISESIPTYFEIPFGSHALAALRGVHRLGKRAKIRMGGVVPEAFPSVSAVVQMLSELARLRVPFKATAGLHHPIRSTQHLTYEPQSATGTMHGFVNLCCAAAVLYFGGSESDAEAVLLEEDPSAWQAGHDSLEWRHLRWPEDQLSTLRREFFISIGSCSFKEPIEDLQGMGWL